jgi:putative DNA primase/helicase
LAELASRHRVAILGITHLNKTGSTKAVYRSMGSLAFAAAARAVWSVVKDANDPARRLFLPAKLNLAENPDGLAYCIREGRVAWEMDPVKMHADDAFAAEMAAAERARMGQGGQRQQATAWLREYVAHGRLPATQIIQDGKEQGFSEVTLRRAHKAMGGKSQKCDYGGGWVWYLPGLEDDQPRPLL